MVATRCSPLRLVEFGNEAFAVDGLPVLVGLAGLQVNRLATDRTKNRSVDYRIGHSPCLLFDTKSLTT